MCGLYLYIKYCMWVYYLVCSVLWLAYDNSWTMKLQYSKIGKVSVSNTYLIWYWYGRIRTQRVSWTFIYFLERKMLDTGGIHGSYVWDTTDHVGYAWRDTFAFSDAFLSTSVNAESSFKYRELETALRYYLSRMVEGKNLGCRSRSVLLLGSIKYIAHGGERKKEKSIQK